MISQLVIDQVIDRAEIVEVVGSYVDLKKAGSNFTCCCPFHSEKTPSFHVNPSRQSWHCFGQCDEGGNVIKFVMKMEGISFPEAVKKLADRYGIEVDSEPESPEEMHKRLKRESLLALNERVAHFYTEQFRKSEKARRYAEERWGKKFVEEQGIGYAPDSFCALRDWGLSRGENRDQLVELGLIRINQEKGTIYDFFRDRLMIPIRDKAGNVIGFTARDLSGNDDVPKYLNSAESVIYNKSQSLWGIDTAWKESARKDMIYIVEGAADAMKMQAVGIANTVAPLGGSCTAEQFRTLLRATRNVCLIPDADPVPADGTHPAGTKYALKNGELAMRNGMNVAVREIPCAEGNRKQDPGSFFTSRSQMDLIKQEDFITWAAGKIFHDDDSITKKSENVRFIAELCACIDDDMAIEMVIPRLTKYAKGKEMWKSTIYKTKWGNSNQQEHKTTTDLRQFGFYEDHNCYYGLSKDGAEVQWSNFVMTPLVHIRDKNNPTRLYQLTAQNGRKEIVELTMDDLNSCGKFRTKIEGIGNFIWMANDAAMIKLKRFLYESTETATRVRMMGWSPEGFYAFGNGILYEEKFVQANDVGLAKYGQKNVYLPSANKIYQREFETFEFEKRFVHLGLNNIRPSDYFRKFVEVYGDNGKVGLCYYVASLFRDIITSHLRYFPILNLFGQKGSGKSEFGQALMAFFVIDNKPANIRNSTSVALNQAASQSANALVHFDEYKNDIDPRKVEFLKGLYDGVGRTRMGGSAYEEIKVTPVKSGVVVSGQEIPTADIALFHRCIFLQFLKSEFTDQETRRYTEIRDIQKLGLSHITIALLKLRQRVEHGFMQHYTDIYYRVSEKLHHIRPETRIVESWCKILAAFACVEKYMEWPMTSQELEKLFTDSIEKQNEMSGNENEMANFWKMMTYLLSIGEIYEECDFQIRKLTEIKTDTMDRKTQEPKRYLFLNTTKIFYLTQKAAQQMNLKSLPEDALRAYLKNSEYYLGSKKSVRFKSIIRGIEEHRGNAAPGVDTCVTRIQRAMVFDYDYLQERYDLSLHNDTVLL